MPLDNANANDRDAYEPAATTRLIESRGGRADRRESIWSVGEPWRWLYFTFFLLLMGAGSSLVGWDTLFGEGASEGVVQLLLAAFMAQAAVSVASAGMSLGITEVVMLSTMLARKLDERKARILREGRQEGMREGRQEGMREGRLAERAVRDAEWDAWLERMAAAQAAGESFDEPPPSRRADDVNGAAGRNGA